MGKTIVNRVKGMNLMTKVSLVLGFTVVFLLAQLLGLNEAIAGTHNLGTITYTNSNITTTAEQLRITIASSAASGGNDATGASVSLSGAGLQASHIASIAVYYNSTLVETVSNPSTLTNITFPGGLTGNQKGGSNWDFYVTFNPSVSVTNFVYTVNSITGTNNNGLPASTSGCTVSTPSAPTLTSPTATSIGTTTATLGANVTSDGGSTVTGRGTVWATSSGPTIPTNQTTTSGTTGVFTTSVSSITAGSKIYYRGYAINGIDTSYSPEGTFYTEPTTQASGVSFSNVGPTGMTVNWSGSGSGDGVIVLMKAGSSVNSNPVDGNYGYTANTAFGSGSQIGTGNYVVFKGSGSSVAVTGLSATTTYYVAVYAYKGTVSDSGVDLGVNYKLTPATGSQITGSITAPVLTSPTAVSITNTTATLGANVTSDGGSAITGRGTVWATTTGPTIPTNQTTTSGTTGVFTTSVSSITAGSKIYYRGYAINGIGTSYSPEGTFYTEPSTQASGVSFTSVGSTFMTVNWSGSGSGDGVIVLMKAGSSVNSNPVDGNYGYTANTAFGNGSQIGTGNYVVFKGSGSSVAVTGLSGNTTYYVAVYAYKGTVSDSGVDLGTNYKLSPATGSQLTNAPTLSATITSCGDCHGYPPADGTRSGATGAVVGSHQKHDYVCSACHVVPATETSADYGHRNGNIQMKAGATAISSGYYDKNNNSAYNSGVDDTFAQTNSPTTSVCRNISCHGGNNPTPQWGGTGATCTLCHSAAINEVYNTRNVANDFTVSSRHVYGGTVTNWDCIVCHAEGDATEASSGVVKTTTLHRNGTTSSNTYVKLRDVDTISTVYDWNKYATGATRETMLTNMDTFCMSCHDSNGASGINVKNTNNGVNLNSTRAMTPFNTSDGLGQGAAAGSFDLSGYYKTKVLDVKTMFDPSNASHHAVLGKAYTDVSSSPWNAGAWVTRTLKNGTALTTVRESASLHCADCHTVDVNAHSGSNAAMLQASSVDGTCFLCHASSTYDGSLGNGLANPTYSRWSHDEEGSAWGDPANIDSSNCRNCHGGDPAQSYQGTSYFYGGIHGIPASQSPDPRSGRLRYRFIGGAYMSADPNNNGNFTTATAAGTCYFDASSKTQAFSTCGQHATSTTGRFSTPNYSRGTPGQY